MRTGTAVAAAAHLLLVAAAGTRRLPAVDMATMVVGTCIPPAVIPIYIMATVITPSLAGTVITEAVDGHITARPMTGRELDHKNMVHNFAFMLLGL